MDRLLRTVLSIREVKVKNDDDFVDRLSRTYTTSLLVVFSFIVSTKQVNMRKNERKKLMVLSNVSTFDLTRLQCCQN